MVVDTEELLGTDLAGYRLESLIGRGGMGVVYLAEDMRLNRRVALKLIAPGLASDPRFRERFLQEAELAASLDHPHVLPVYGAGETDGRLWIAMRYVQGEDLSTLLAREGRLPSRRAVELVGQVGEALDAAHARGLVHRDVKPANVLVAEVAAGEHCYLTDFGLARARQDEGLGPTAAHLSGTVAYAAPERIAGRFVDGRADVYSLGCVLFECLAGEPPFVRPRLTATLAAHIEAEPPSVRALRPQLPPQMDAVVAKALAKDPGERYATCGELTEAARAALAPAAPWWRSRRAAAVLAALVLVALAAALAVVLARGAAEPAAESPAIPTGNSLVRLDASTGEVVAGVAFEGSPVSVAADERNVWVVEDSEIANELGTLSRIDPLSNEVTGTFDIPNEGWIMGLDAAGGDVWLTAEVGEQGSFRREVLRLAAGADALEPVDIPFEIGWAPPVVAGGSLWIVTEAGDLVRVDPQTSRVLARLEGDFGGLIAGDGFLWALPSTDEWEPVRVDTSTNEIRVLPDLPSSEDFAGQGQGGPSAAFGEGLVWVSDWENRRVVGLHPVSGRVVAESFIDGYGIDAGGGAVWGMSDFTVYRHDPFDPYFPGPVVTNVGGMPRDMAIAGDSVWVAVAEQ